MSKAPFILKYGSQTIPPTSEFIKSLRFRFSFVRNPYDRFASTLLNLEYATPETFEKYTLTTFKNGYKERFANSDFDWQNLWPASKFLYFDGKLEVDFVGRFENLLTDWDKVCEMIDDEFELPHLNKSKYKSYDRFYTPATRKIVRKAYADDFALFDYKL
jgi:hypothetical protein